MIQIDVVMPRLFVEGATELQVQMALESGSLTALVGPSGSGKTTVLRLLAGLETPKMGHIAANNTVWLDTRQGVNLPPQKRAIGYVFQDTALFPNMTVRENIDYAALPGPKEFVSELIETTGLATLAHQKPGRLSGGQRQRVALARALVRRPQLLLLDEPFAALDAEASQQLQQVLMYLHQTWGTTTLLVSHHEADVRTLASRVIRLVQGQVQTDNRLESLPSTATEGERITGITYDEVRQHWVIETPLSTIQSANPAWGQLRVGDCVQLPGLSAGIKNL